MTNKQIRRLLIIPIILALAFAFVFIRNKWTSRATSPLSVVHTIAGATRDGSAPVFDDPFGIAEGEDGSIYVTDGDAGKLWQIKRDGTARLISDALNMPSGIAVAPDGWLVIAETGSHVIRRTNPTDGRTEIIGGTVNQAGFADGAQDKSLFNGPIAVAVGNDGTVYVADTYNDRIRAIDKDGNVRTVAGGGAAGFADADSGSEARFNTPCGIAVAPDGGLIVADTGNHRIRRVELNGSVRTIAGTGERSSDDGFLFSASFNEPIGVAVDTDGTIYIADSRGSALRSCGWDLFPRVSTLVGGLMVGFEDGEIRNARLNRPAGIALAHDGTILFTDNGNKVVRGIVGKGRERGAPLKSDALSSSILTASQMRSAAPGRWPYDPPDRRREIAATFGEIRGELTGSDRQAWFHNGLDIPGAYGETVRAVRTERVRDPLAIEDVGTARERLRFPAIGYIHVRVGRDANDRVFDDAKFLTQRNPEGKITSLRVRRGSLFTAGDPLGTLNNQNHVHLIAGPVGKELNAIAALELPDIKDAVVPSIESNGVQLYDNLWRELRIDDKDGRIPVSGGVRIVVRAYDQMDDNAARRRLGVYRLGYQVFASDGSPASGFAEPVMTISFERLPRADEAAHIAYATGSRSGATGETIFAYIVTNIVRDTEARESIWDTAKLAPGNYLLRVIAEDYFGNRATKDLAVRISSTKN